MVRPLRPENLFSTGTRSDSSPINSRFLLCLTASAWHSSSQLPSLFHGTFLIGPGRKGGLRIVYPARDVVQKLNKHGPLSSETGFSVLLLRGHFPLVFLLRLIHI